MGALGPGLVLIAIAASAIALVSCGGGDEDANTGAAGSQRQAQVKAEVEAQNKEVMEEYERRQAAQAPSEEEVEAKQTATDFYAILATEEGDANSTTLDSAAFCELMSEEARERTIQYARVSSGIAQDWDCQSAVELLVLRSKGAGGLERVRKAEVVGVNTAGDRATATVRFPGHRALTTIPLIREDGEWKLAATGVGR